MRRPECRMRGAWVPTRVARRGGYTALEEAVEDACVPPGEYRLTVQDNNSEGSVGWDGGALHLLQPPPATSGAGSGTGAGALINAAAAKRAEGGCLLATLDFDPKSVQTGGAFASSVRGCRLTS